MIEWIIGIPLLVFGVYEKSKEIKGNSNSYLETCQNFSDYICIKAKEQTESLKLNITKRLKKSSDEEVKKLLANQEITPWVKKLIKQEAKERGINNV